MSVIWLPCIKCNEIFGRIEWENEECDDCQKGYCDVSYLYNNRNIDKITEEDSPF